MRKTDVIQHFGSAAKVAAALDISRAAVSQWPEDVPESSAYKIESVTGGALRVAPDDAAPREEAAA